MEELLRILEKNARMPIEDIAAMLDKTPEEIAAMMDEAAAKGYIRGYETLVDWEQAGVNLVEAVIELRVTPHKARGFDDIGMTIAQFDEVDTVLLMSGSYDLQVIIKGRSFQEIAIFVAKRLSPLDDVLSTATSFVLRQCDDQIEMMRDEYNRRRRYVVKALNDMGLSCFEPRGAFYVFPSIQISGLTSSEFCEQLLREKEVAIIPGSAFGASGEGYARISYAYSVDHLQTAMKRIREFLTEHGWMKK